MKTTILLFASLSVYVMPCAAQGDNPSRLPSPFGFDTPLQFDTEEWSFGKIAEDGGEASHRFEFVNTGEVPIAIDRVVTSCGCTTPEYPTRTIAPGAKASVTVNFDPMGFIGDFSKSVTVVSGGGKFRNYLVVTGHITPRVRTPEEEYPYDMGGGLRFDGTVLAFRTVPQGRSAAMAIRYINTSGRDAELAVEPVEQSGLLDIYAPRIVCAGCEGTLTLTYDLSVHENYGPVHDVLMVVVDGVPSLKTIYTATTGVDNFANVDLDTAPKLSLDTQFHDFGTAKRQTTPYTHRFTASNEGRDTLHIRSVSTGTRISGTGSTGGATKTQGLGTTLRAATSIAPGESLPFEVIFHSDRYQPGPLHESIIVVVDDPVRPVREIRIAANIE